MNMAKQASFRSELKSKTVLFGIACTKHFGSRKIGYWNSHTDFGYVVQLSLYTVAYKHRVTNRKVFVIVMDMLQEQYDQEQSKYCIVVAKLRDKLQYIKQVKYEHVALACVNASVPEEQGDLEEYVDENNLLKDPRHIVSVCLHHFDELWSSESSF